jgi:hypothetical protein
MQRSSWANSFGWAVIGGILAPAALVAVLLQRSARRRAIRALLVVRRGMANVRDEVFGEFSLEEFVTGTMTRRPRR